MPGALSPQKQTHTHIRIQIQNAVTCAHEAQFAADMLGFLSYSIIAPHPPRQSTCYITKPQPKAVKDKYVLLD